MAENVKNLEADACVMIIDYREAHHIPFVEAFSHFIDEMLINGTTQS